MDYDAWNLESPLEFKKILLKNFIEKTVKYAEDHIKFRQSQIINEEISELEKKNLRMLKWISYIEFQKHTLAELDSDKLDHFL